MSSTDDGAASATVASNPALSLAESASPTQMEPGNLALDSTEGSAQGPVQDLVPISDPESSLRELDRPQENTEAAHGPKNLATMIIGVPTGIKIFS